MMFKTTYLLAAAAAGASLLGASDAQAQGKQFYPAFCQGMSIDGGENRMFVSRTFAYPQSADPQGGVLQEGSAGTEFAQEVKRRSGKDLLDSVCHSRATAAEISDFAESTVRANGAGWTVETLEWRPRGARPLSLESATAEPVAPADPARSSAAAARAAAAERLAAERAEAAERRAAEERANAEALRAANAAALAVTAEQTRKILEEKKAAEERLKQFQNEQRAYELAKAQHQASVQAAEAARRKWEADVAACRAGDVSRCGAPVSN